jgi:protein-L-isoaspartate(D-aspartate) O-methyltransferase
MTNTLDTFNDGETSRNDLFEHLKHESDVLRSEALEQAFKEIDRKDFVPGDYLPEAYEDYPLPLADESTISQPTTVAFMLELLDIQEGDRVLDVGSGSGWTTALIAHMVGADGFVLGLEINNDLVEFGRRNLLKYDFPHARIEHPTSVSLDEESFDKILISAEMKEIPKTFLDTLRDGGLLLAPFGSSLKLMRKQDGELTTERSIEGFVFVPYKYGAAD